MVKNYCHTSDLQNRTELERCKVQGRRRKKMLSKNDLTIHSKVNYKEGGGRRRKMHSKTYLNIHSNLQKEKRGITIFFSLQKEEGGRTRSFSLQKEEEQGRTR